MRDMMDDIKRRVRAFIRLVIVITIIFGAIFVVLAGGGLVGHFFGQDSLAWQLYWILMIAPALSAFLYCLIYTNCDGGSFHEWISGRKAGRPRTPKLERAAGRGPSDASVG